MPSPTNNLLKLLLVLAGLSIPASLWGFEKWWWGLLGFFGLIVFIDLLTGMFHQPLLIKRKINRTLALGVWSDVDLEIFNDDNRPIKLQVFDHVPQSMKFKKLPATALIPASSRLTVNYSIYPEERGDHDFKTLQARRSSRIKLWHFTKKLTLETHCRVYPNFSAVSQYALLALDNRLGQLGINKHRRRGEGQEFHQLREYRQGDSLKKVDWKATSKHRKLISREFNDEQNQEILLMIDCGHRMRTKDGELSHFDHSLNAALLLSYVALQQGDAVGVGTFSSNNDETNHQHWVKPARGKRNLQRILNSVYDIQPGTYAPDYSAAAKSILMRQKKRALIVFITNVRDEDNDDLCAALILLKKRHLVLVASMREQVLDNAIQHKVENFDDAIRVCAAHEYLYHRQNTFDQIRAANALGFDVSPEKLSVELVNDYLKIKSSGVL